MTVQGMQQHEQSSVERQLHLPGCGLTTEPAVEEMVEAGISMCVGAIDSIKEWLWDVKLCERCVAVEANA
jgi:hypothetical protein